MKPAPEQQSIDPGMNILLALGCFILYSLIYLISTLNFSGIHLVLFHLIVLLLPATGIVALGQIAKNESVAHFLTFFGYALFGVSILSIIIDAIV